jgi:uncharacterized protein YbjT (DUF2867 family)
MFLVVTGTGQLGTRVVRKLIDRGQPVRALVRESSDHAHLTDSGAEIVYGDLRDADSIDAAVQGVDKIVATANAIVGRARGDSLATVDGTGYGHLIDAARRHQVSRLVFMSVPVTPYDEKSSQFRHKRLNERRIIESGVPYTIFRCAMFADVWPALIGSSIPYRGAEAPSLERPNRFTRLFRRATGTMVEDKGKAMIPGGPEIRNSFITLEDAAEFLVRALDHPQTENEIVEIGGPEHLSWQEVVATFESVLDKPIKASYSPPGLFAALAVLYRPFSPTASSLMQVNRLAGSGSLETYAASGSAQKSAELFDIELTRFEDFLREKASLPAA